MKIKPLAYLVAIMTNVNSYISYENDDPGHTRKQSVLV